MLRREADGSLVPHGSLLPWAAGNANDLVVADNGQAYAGNFGFDLDGLYDGTVDRSAIATTSLVRVDPDGTSHEAASDLAFPNGTVITDDGATLIIAESFGGHLTRVRPGARRLAQRAARVGPARRRRARRHLPVCRRLGLGGQRQQPRMRAGGRRGRDPRAGHDQPDLLRLHAGRRATARPSIWSRRPPATPRWPACNATAPWSRPAPRYPGPACRSQPRRLSLHALARRNSLWSSHDSRNRASRLSPWRYGGYLSQRPNMSIISLISANRSDISANRKRTAKGISSMPTVDHEVVSLAGGCAHQRTQSLSRPAAQPSLVSAPRKFRTAWLMRCSFSMRANRTWPSPPGPNPTPGEVATSASLTRCLANSSDPISR